MEVKDSSSVSTDFKNFADHDPKGKGLPKSGNVVIRSHKMHYELRGHGPEVMLCVPGAVGTGKKDYSPQLEYFGVQNASRYTIVAVDPLGYGESRPPERDFHVPVPDHFLKTDAMDAHQLMQALSFDKFSILGWCDGGVTAIIMAALFPESVKKLVVWGTKAYITKQDIELLERTRNLADWDQRMREFREKTYGDSLQKLWSHVVDAMIEIYKQRNGDLCMTEVQRVQCPTMVLHGMKDALCPRVHAVYLKEQLLKNGVSANLVEISEGKHNLQLRNAKELNTHVENFLRS